MPSHTTLVFSTILIGCFSFSPAIKAGDETWGPFKCQTQCTEKLCKNSPSSAEECVKKCTSGGVKVCSEVHTIRTDYITKVNKLLQEIDQAQARVNQSRAIAKIFKQKASEHLDVINRGVARYQTLIAQTKTEIEGLEKSSPRTPQQQTQIKALNEKLTSYEKYLNNIQQDKQDREKAIETLAKAAKELPQRLEDQRTYKILTFWKEHPDIKLDCSQDVCLDPAKQNAQK